MEDAELTEVEREEKMAEYGALLEEMQRNDPAKYRRFVDAMQAQVNAAKGFEPKVPGGKVMSSGGLSENGASDPRKEGAKVTPVPGFVLKTRDAAAAAEGGGKVFVNICQSTQVGAPAPTKRVVEEGGPLQEGMSMPISLGAGRRDADKKGETCTIYDCIVNPAVVTQATKGDLSGEYRHLVCETALSYIEQKYGRKLDHRYKLIRSKYKGEIASQWIRVKKKAGPTIQEIGRDGPSEAALRQKRKLAAARDAAKRAPKSSIRHTIFGDYGGGDCGGAETSSEDSSELKQIAPSTYGEERWDDCDAEGDAAPSAATKVPPTTTLRLAPAPRALLLVFEFSRAALVRARDLEEAETEAAAFAGVALAMPPRDALPPGLKLTLSRRMAAVSCQGHVPLHLFLPFAVATDAKLVVIDAVTAYSEGAAQLRVSLRVDRVANRPASATLLDNREGGGGGNGNGGVKRVVGWRQPDPGSRPWLVRDAIARTDDEERMVADVRGSSSSSSSSSSVEVGDGSGSTFVDKTNSSGSEILKKRFGKGLAAEDEVLPEDRFLSQDLLSQHWIQEKQRERDELERKAEAKRQRQEDPDNDEEKPIDLVEYARQNDPKFAGERARDAARELALAAIPQRPSVGDNVASDATFESATDETLVLDSDGIFDLLDDFSFGSAADI